MKKKLTILVALLISIGLFIGCSDDNKTTDKDTTNKTEDTAKKEINKADYEKADFVKFNVPDAEYKNLVGTKVYIEAVISQVDLEGRVFDSYPNLALSQKEGDGYGIYLARGYELKDCGLNFAKDDKVIIYGFIDPQKASTGEPAIFVEKIEKN